MELFNRTNKGLYLYSSFPKSGSNHVLELIKIGSNYSIKDVIPKLSSSYGNNFIDINKIVGSLGNYKKEILIYGHIPFHMHTRLILDKLNFERKILVSIRSLPDVVVSYKEHIDKYGGGPLDHRIVGAQECNHNWINLSDTEKYDYIIKFIIPWYVTFIVGWVSAGSKLDVKFITFEEHTLFPANSICNIFKFLEISNHGDKLLNKNFNVNKIKSNFNVGLSGRGHNLLTNKQTNSIESLFKNFDNDLKRSYLVKYLLYGYEGLPFTIEDIVKDDESLNFTL